jgi:peptide/nickel transport system substrate-binding protein
MVAGLEAEEIDFVPDMDVEQAKQFDGKKGYTVLWTSTGQGHGIQWNTHVKTDPRTGKPNPFLDQRVRLAANYAVDRDAYIKALLTGKEPYAYGLSSLSFGFPKGQIEHLTRKYDLARAKALMKEAGYEDGFEVDFYLGTGFFPKSEQVILAVAQDLAKIGIRTKVITMPFADLLPVMRKHEAPGLFYFGSSATVDANGNAVAFWADEGFYNQAFLPELGLQKLFEEESAEFDPVKRKEILKRAWTAHYEGAGWLFLHETIQASVYTDKVAWEPSGGPDRIPRVPANYQFKVLA